MIVIRPSRLKICAPLVLRTKTGVALTRADNVVDCASMVPTQLGRQLERGGLFPQKRRRWTEAPVRLKRTKPNLGSFCTYITSRVGIVGPPALPRIARASYT